METGPAKPVAQRVTRSQILARGLALSCPNCGAHTLYRKNHYFQLERACSACGMRWDKDEAGFLGSVVLNYGVTAFGIVLPGIVIATLLNVPRNGIVAGALAAGLIIPILLYRPSKSWWLMCYHLFFPDHLPANWSTERHGAALPPDE